MPRRESSLHRYDRGDAGPPPLDYTIERVLIGHYDAHGADIDLKLRF